MIKLAEKNMLSSILDFAKTKYSENLYIIADIESIAYDLKKFMIWYNENDGKIDAIFLKYKNNIIIFSENQQYNKNEVVNLIKNYNIKRVNGFENSLAAILSDLKDDYKIKECYYCVLRNSSNLRASCRTELLNNKNIGMVSEAMSEVPEIEMTQKECLENLQYKLDKNLPTKLLKIDNKVVSFASISTISSYSAMIVTVFTIPSERRKGYSQEVLSSLIVDMCNQNKECCLIYENEIAGNLYSKLGFKSIGKWLTLDYIEDKN